jgi:hypothetical protein
MLKRLLFGVAIGLTILGVEHISGKCLAIDPFCKINQNDRLGK